jgi:hypothetical protein
LAIFGPFLIASASITWRLAYICHTSFIALYIALACYIIDSDRGDSLVICGYAPKTRRVGMMPSGLAKSFIALTAIYKMVSLAVIANSSLDKISNARQSGA